MTDLIDIAKECYKNRRARGVNIEQAYRTAKCYLFAIYVSRRQL